MTMVGSRIWKLHCTVRPISDGSKVPQSNPGQIAKEFILAGISLQSWRENQKAAQCSLGSINDPVHCIADISCVCILLCMSDFHHVHCTCPSPHKWTKLNIILSYQSHWQIIMWICDLLRKNWYFITTPIHMNYQTPATCDKYGVQIYIDHDAWRTWWGSLPWCGMACPPSR